MRDEFKVKWEVDATARSLLKAMSEDIDGYEQRTRKEGVGNSGVEFGDHLEAKFLNGILVRSMEWYMLKIYRDVGNLAIDAICSIYPKKSPCADNGIPKKS